jgi:hypothetical protein
MKGGRLELTGRSSGPPAIYTFQYIFPELSQFCGKSGTPLINLFQVKKWFVTATMLVPVPVANHLEQTSSMLALWIRPNPA